MKTLNILIAFIFSFSALSFTSQFNTLPESKANVKVYGNCGMCKTRIETAAKTAGATSASWNNDSKTLSVSFAPSKVTLKTIEESIAAVGHDTEHATANNEAYNGLHGCCKYERKTGASLGSASIAKTTCCKNDGSCTAAACCTPTGQVDCCEAASGATCCPLRKACCSK